VIEAASKFVEKPDTNLLPAPSAAMQPQAAQTASAAFQPAVNLAAEQKAQLQQAPAAMGPKYTGEPISVNLKDVDLKDFFRLIHEISGLNVVLDPNVKGSLTIVLDDVPWDQALDIVLKNNDLDRQLEGNVLRIATLETLRTEAESRRKAQEAEALAVDKVTVTRFLSYAHSHDVVATIKKFLSQRGDVISDDRTNAIIISDIPSVMPAIDRLLTQLDRKTQEVEIEARVVAATRSFARDIGTQLGFGFGNAGSAVGGASGAGTSPITSGIANPSYIVVPGTGTAGSTIPLFSNLGATSPTSGLSFITASGTVRLDAILTMAESRGLLKILSRPRIVTQNNISAVVKQGTRVPIVTLAQLGGPPTVTYVDAFLRLTVVPQITSEKTIFLNVDVENTTPDFGHAIQGNPSLITQQATTQVLVTDGGTVVIGGVIQTNNSISISQVPLLGNIPFLGNLFKHTTVSTSNAELIFFITPRVIET
jgi:type IV pilus assembly protein PilQ